MDKQKHTFIDARNIGDIIEYIEQCREEEPMEQISSSKKVQQKGILSERGIRKSTSYHKPKMTEVIGDSQQNICRRREELVLQTINEFAEQLRLDPNYAQTKGLLIEKGIRKYTENQGAFIKRDYMPPEKMVEHSVENFANQSSPIYRSPDINNLRIEKGLKLSWENKKNTLENGSFDMPKILSYIQQFNKSLDNNSGNINWTDFRKNLLKIHRYYMKQHSFICSDEEYAVDDVGENPLNKFGQDSKTLKKNETCKINSLDLKMQEFYIKYNRTLINREKTFKEMMTLQSMHKQIGQRLSQIEMEIHASRSQLLKRGVHNK
ncbi:uncharacterized protein LOC132793032 isoform X1 [Drosophila nasuta]|uniref:uncharacterized protein LOC132793032 isoform X1 n=1 Tax=Drosophila nasuta TaxID=42062 RepID=UPI00295F29C7|nr:uncharacterized protein LOC132793032 isoform X1 [Drosophila nasuta]